VIELLAFWDWLVDCDWPSVLQLEHPDAVWL
jgi:hypothetical protein